jgi:hypothetical protein
MRTKTLGAATFQYLGMAALYGLVAVPVLALDFWLAAAIVSRQFVYESSALGAIAVLVFAVPLIGFGLVIVPFMFISQWFVLLALFWRSLWAPDPEAPLARRVRVGSGSRQYFEYHPIRNSRWTGLWMLVLSLLFSRHWRLYLALYALLLAPGILFVLPREVPTVVAVVPLLACAALVVWQQRSRPISATTELARQEKDELDLTPAYYRGLAYREGKRLRDLQELEDAATAPTATPEQLETWLAAAAKESIRGESAGIELWRQQGDDAKLDAARQRLREATAGRVDDDRIRELVREAATFRRRSRTR